MHMHHDRKYRQPLGQAASSTDTEAVTAKSTSSRQRCYLLDSSIGGRPILGLS